MTGCSVSMSYFCSGSTNHCRLENMVGVLGISVSSSIIMSVVVWLPVVV